MILANTNSAWEQRREQWEYKERNNGVIQIPVAFILDENNDFYPTTMKAGYYQTKHINNVVHLITMNPREWPESSGTKYRGSTTTGISLEDWHKHKDDDFIILLEWQ